MCLTFERHWSAIPSHAKLCLLLCRSIYDSVREPGSCQFYSELRGQPGVGHTGFRVWGVHGGSMCGSVVKANHSTWWISKGWPHSVITSTAQASHHQHLVKGQTASVEGMDTPDLASFCLLSTSNRSHLPYPSANHPPHMYPSITCQALSTPTSLGWLESCIVFLLTD